MRTFHLLLPVGGKKSGSFNTLNNYKLRITVNIRSGELVSTSDGYMKISCLLHKLNVLT